MIRPMTDFQSIKNFNCNLDFNLTHLLTVGVMISSIVFLEAVKFFVCFFFIDCFTTSMLKVPPNILPENIEF